MINYQDNYVLYDENEYYEIFLYSTIGNRSEQQDRVGYEFKDIGGLVVLCDGMGGHEGGSLASNIAVEEFLRAYQAYTGDDNPQQFLLQMIDSLDKKIASLRKPDHTKMRAGSTLSAILLEKNNLHWISVGDSRIYIYRKDEFVQVTQDHNYKMLLDEKKQQGKISEAEHKSEMSKGNVLVSFLGVNGLPYVEHNSAPLELLSGDIIVLITDGIYKLLSDDEVREKLKEGQTLEDILKNIHSLTKQKAIANNVKQDNISIALIKIK